MNVPLFPFLVFYILGIIIGYYIFIPFHFVIVFLCALLIIFSLSLLFRWRTASHMLIFSALMTLGIFFIHLSQYPHFPPNHIKNFVFEKKQVLEGILYRTPDYSWNRTRIYLSLIAIDEGKRSYPITGRFLLTIKNCPSHLDIGDRIRFLSRVNTPRNFGNPGCFDYVGTIAREGIYATGFMPDDKYLAKMGRGLDYLRLLEALRNRIRETFVKNLESPCQGIALALVLGERGNIPPDLNEDIVIAGVAHILSISGLHIGIVAAVVYLLIRWVLTRSYHLTLLISVKKWASFLAIFPVFFYALLAGWNLPTQRSVIMVVAYLIAMILSRERDFMNTLCLAALVIVFLASPSLFDISFQLSFVSVFFLIYLIPKLSLLLPEEKLISKLRFRWEMTTFRWLKDSIFATLSATLGTLPLVALYFNRIPIMGIVSNLILIPLLGFLAVCLGLLIAILSLISPAITIPFLRLDEQIIDSSVILIRFFAHLPCSELRVSTPTVLEIFLFYTGIFLLCNVRRGRVFRYAFASIILLLCTDFLYYTYQDRFNNDLRVTFLDGGQGEAALVEFPYGGKMLIDGGGFRNDDAIDVGERAIAPFLWKRKIAKLDDIVLTHPHPDHLNGLPFIARNFRPRLFWWNGDKALPPLSEKLHEVMGSTKRGSLVVNSTTPSFMVNGARIDFLNPPSKSTWVGNNNSLAFRIVLGEVSFLLTGDIQKESESEIIDSGKYIKSTVIKVPHHGSLTSSSEEFIKAVNPKVAVFTGKLGKFLPHPRIIQRYKEMGIETIRIDQQGAVSFVTDGRKLWVKELKSGIMTSVIP